jgi:dual specificity MAP kinase phosphatase
MAVLQEMSVAALAAFLEGNVGVLVIDTRPFMTFNSSHVSTAHNVHCPPIVKRRSGGCISLENVIRCPKARGALLEGRYSSVVVYDESSLTIQDIPRDSNAELVIKCLTEHVRVSSLFFLQGRCFNPHTSDVQGQMMLSYS